MDWVVLSLLDGLSLGAILFILAAGLSITLGMMGIVNLAHGALFMVGGYVGWTVAVQLGLSYGLAVLAGGIAAGLIGSGIERGFLSGMYKLPLDQALLTAGFIYILINLSLWIWGAAYRVPFTAPILSGSFPLVGWKYPVHRIGTIAIGFIILIILWWFQEKTHAGTIIRAGTDDKQMTIGLGINLNRVSRIVFFAGAFTTGAAGVIAAQIMTLNLEMGFEILALALVVVIVGGVGSTQGAFVGAMIIGLIKSFGSYLFPEIAAFLMYIVMIIILLVKPSGLIPRK